MKIAVFGTSSRTAGRILERRNVLVTSLMGLRAFAHGHDHPITKRTTPAEVSIP